MTPFLSCSYYYVAISVLQILSIYVTSLSISLSLSLLFSFAFLNSISSVNIPKLSATALPTRPSQNTKLSNVLKTRIRNLLNAIVIYLQHFWSLNPNNSKLSLYLPNIGMWLTYTYIIFIHIYSKLCRNYPALNYSKKKKKLLQWFNQFTSI